MARPKFSIWCEIVCRSCARTATGEFTSSTIRRDAMRKEALKEGFIFFDDETFCSDSCLEDYKEKKNDD